MAITMITKGVMALTALTAACAACGLGFTGVGNVCYSIADMTASWTDALTLCMAQYAYLADINSEAEQSIVVGLARQIPGLTRAWIGASKNLPIKGTWLWIHNGNTMPTEYFAPGQPDGDGNCVNLWEPGGFKWNDENCSRKVHFVCKYYEGSGSCPDWR